MAFSTGPTLTKTKGLKMVDWADMKLAVEEPNKLAVTAAQYNKMASAQRGELKKQQSYFITSDAKTRSDKAVKAAGLSGIVLDLDNPTLGINDIEKKLIENQVSCFGIYTTLSHTIEQPRYRVVIPLEETAKAERWKIVVNYLNEELFADSDDCSKTMAQAWLLPVVTADGDYDFKIYEGGQQLNINDDNHPFINRILSANSIF